MQCIITDVSVLKLRRRGVYINNSIYVCVSVYEYICILIYNLYVTVFK